MIEDTDILDFLDQHLVRSCVSNGSYSTSSSNQSDYIRRLVQVVQQFHQDVQLGFLDLLKRTIESIEDFDSVQNGELNSVTIRLFLTEGMTFFDFP